MDAAPGLHPSDKDLSAYGLGKLDDRAARSVNEHLERCDECRDHVAGTSADSFLKGVRDARGDASLFGSSQPSGTRSYRASSPPPPADTLPPGLADHPDYEIRKELGRGGMGVVYLAHNTLMGRDEVLKVMSRRIIERPGVLDRFLREIRAVAKLRHPNIVTAYSATRLGESIVFGMEFVDGLDLSKLVKAKGPLPVAHSCNFIHQAALGLQHAHEEGLVHRDIKPGNLMLSRKGEKAVVKVLDFGLSKVTREENVDGGLTHEGQALGTPDYIAPEQILDAQKADVRADIYSLGGTLYYLLTGRPPFKGNSLYDIYQAHISRDADPLNLVRPEVPAELAALVAKMMAKDPARRFQTPAEVALALTPFFKAALPRMPSEAARPKPPALVTPEPAPAPPLSRPPNAPVVKRPEPVSGFESLIALDRAEHAGESILAPASRRPPRKAWPLVAAASLLGLVVLGAVVLSLREKGDDARIVPTKNTSRKIAKDDLGPSAVSRVTKAERAVPSTSEKSEPSTVSRSEPETVVPKTPPIAAPAPIPREDGWVSLFNGNDLKGWVVDGRRGCTWEVADGVLTGRAPNDGPGLSYVLTQRDYSDFHLRFEFQLPMPCNSGVAIRAIPGEDPFHIEISLRNFADGRAPAGALGWFGSGDAAKFLPPSRVPALNPKGTWNRMEIEMRGQDVRVSVNGEPTADWDLRKYADLPGALPGLKRWAGRIGFQSVAGVALFRNIEIRDLADGSGRPPIATASRFVPLFNHKDLTGWKTHPGQPGHWRVEDGILKCSGARTSHLYSERADFKNVHLRVKVRVNESGSGGIYARSPFGPARPANAPVFCAGYEAPINCSIPDLIKTGSLYTPIGAWAVSVPKSPVPPGQWMLLELIQVGDRAVVKVDGKVTADHEGPRETIPESGHVVLLQHRTSTLIEFADVEVGSPNARPE